MPELSILVWDKEGMWSTDTWVSLLLILQTPDHFCITSLATECNYSKADVAPAARVLHKLFYLLRMGAWDINSLYIYN